VPLLPILAILLQVPLLAFAAADEAAVSAPRPGDADGEYEVDYEEEADAGAEAEEAPAPVKGRSKDGSKARSRNANGPAVQGSRAKNRFVPILKSDTRSVYQRKGKAYDVDTD